MEERPSTEMFVDDTFYFQINDGLDDEEDDDVPTENIIERMEERLDLAQNQQKRLFLIIFQVKKTNTHLVISHLTNCSHMTYAIITEASLVRFF